MSQVIVNVDPNVAAFAAALAKFASDVKSITGPGAGSVASESIALLSASLMDLVPSLGSLSAVEVAAKASPVEFVEALVASIAPALGF